MISKFFTANQRFHSVGQGLFYSMDLKIGSDYYSFNFVYDCGSLSVKEYLTEEIDYFRSYHDIIDLLVVSHFDEDHVNGIADLIKGKKVKKLVLPYVDWKERLAVAVTLTDSDQEEYLALLSDPLTFFSSEEFDIDEILIVGTSRGGVLPEEERPSPISPKSNEVSNKENFGRLGTTVYTKETELTDTQVMNFFLQAVPYPIEKIKFYPHGLKILAGTFWEFELYNQESTDALKIQRLEKTLNSYLAKKKISKFELFESAHRAEVRKIYRSIYSNLNQTSIVLYHGAVQEHQIVQHTSIYDTYSGNWNNIEVLSNEKTGTLLTGDLKISSSKPLDKLVSHFREFLPLVVYFPCPIMVPQQIGTFYIRTDWKILNFMFRQRESIVYIIHRKL
jgi:hypothetical protein